MISTPSLRRPRLCPGVVPPDRVDELPDELVGEPVIAVSGAAAERLRCLHIVTHGLPIDLSFTGDRPFTVAANTPRVVEFGTEQSWGGFQMGCYKAVVRVSMIPISQSSLTGISVVERDPRCRKGSHRHRCVWSVSDHPPVQRGQASIDRSFPPCAPKSRISRDDFVPGLASRAAAIRPAVALRPAD